MIAALVPQAPKRARPAGKDFQHWCVSRRAMGCEFTIMVPPDQPSPMASAEAALDEIGDLEDLLSVYRGDSAVSRLNQQAAESPVRINYRLYELLKRSAELTRQTEGAFDVATGAMVRAWGFLRGPKRVPDQTEWQEAFARSGMRHVVFDDEAASVRYTVPGLEINLGSIGKGYGIDEALKRMMTDFGTDCVLIQGGRSSVRAIGSPAGDEHGWLLAIQNPFEPDRRLGAVYLKDRALATSSSVNQFFEAGGQRYGHLIDPRSGRPADGLAS
ncbi:MAG: FAD:protein FMN transferase, partial [Planctomycetes bacterium]|nr:FAD:protein FMN transferase [Planctomycetota bacterium]